MRIRTRMLTAGVAGLVAAMAMAPVAVAAAPSNDEFTGATAATIGFSEVLDTTDATTDADDAQLNSECGAPATDASVWYSIVGDGAVVVDVSTSDYTAGVAVGTGTQGSLSLVTCGPSGVAFVAEAGTTYYVLAFDDQSDGSGNGGSLSISFSDAPPPPSFDVTIDSRGTVDKAGVARVTGTVACTDADVVDVEVQARQRVGRGFVDGFGFAVLDGICDGTAQPWAVQVYPDGGKFAGGKSLTATFAFGCGAFFCETGYVEQTVQLRGTRR